MSRKRKILERIRNNPTNVPFEDIDRLLKLAGFTCRQPHGGSSHYGYTIKGCPEILTVPRHKPVGSIYVKMALKAIETYGNLDEDTPED